MDERISRRNFLRGVGVSAVAGAVAKVSVAAETVESLDNQKPIGPGPVKLVLKINGKKEAVEVEPRVTLLDVLRNRLQLTGTKEVCDRATCGACTVLVNGQAVYSCTKLAVEAQGQEITTIEGLGTPNELTPIQRAFVECDAMMCGYCTPGFVMSLTALFRANSSPTNEEIKKACSGNLCRCGAYPHIYKAALKLNAGNARNAASAVNDVPSVAGDPGNSSAESVTKGWPKNPKQLGKEHLRYTGPAEVTGTAKYASDMQPAGWLYGMILRASWPAARIRTIDLRPALSVPGIRAAVTANDPPFSVRYYGEELAAVAGISKEACLDALKAIKIDADRLSFVVNEEDALRDTAPRVFENQPNGGAPREMKTGEVDTAFATADKIVEGLFQTQVQLHQCLETHGNTVQFTPDLLTCWASTQGIFSVKDSLADNAGMPQDKIHVMSDFMGGGFGSKFGAGVEGGLAVKLSKEAGNLPVRLMLTRFDEALAVGNRPSSFQKIRLGAKNDGTLVAYELDAFGTAGYASGGATAGGGGGAGFPAPYIYKILNTHVRQTTVAVNAGSSRAMRAPGHPQASFGMESILDEMAGALGMDPVELRIKNDPLDIRRQQYRIAAERFGWKHLAPGSSEGPVKTGFGCAGGTWGGGGRASEAEVRINPDGSVEVRCGTQDLGTGTKTLIAIVAAEVFGLETGAISVMVGDTNFPPSGGSGGSTTAASVAPAVFDACQNALANLGSLSGLSDPTGSNWRSATARLQVNPIVAHGRWREGLSGKGVGGVQMAEVAVDTETGFVRVKRIVCVQDCGLVVNRLGCISQLNGGIILGIGFALYEERIMDRQTGVVLNPNFETYKLPGAADVPELDLILQDMPERGVIGIGEPACIPTAAAIANAVSNAIGKRVTRLPMTPARILSLLGKEQRPATG